MKKLLVWIVMIIMVMTMLLPTSFAAEKTSFTERTPELKSISSDEFGVVTLSWKAVEGAYQYGVYQKKTGEDKWVRLGLTKKTSYTNYSAALNQQYQYTVRAFKKDTDIQSKRDTKGLKITPKRKVLELASVKNAGLEAIRLDWEKLSGDVKYYIVRKESGGKWKNIKNVSNADTWTDTSVKNGKKYSYRIYAKKTVDGKEYRTAYGTEGKSVTCNNKTAVKLGEVKKTTNGVTVTWSAQPGADLYYVYKKTQGQDWKYLEKTKNTSYSDADSNSGKAYYTVRGVKKRETGVLTSWRDMDGISVLDKIQPTLKSIENTGLEAVTLRWKKFSGAQSYRVYRKVPGGEYKLLKSGVTGTSFTDKTAKDGKTYIYTVSACIKKGGKITYSKKAEGMKIKSAPAKSVSLRSVTVGFNSAKVKWNAVPGADSYHVLRKTEGGSWQRIASYVEGTSYTDKTLKSKKNYVYSVRAVKKLSSAKTISTGYNSKGLSAKGGVPDAVKMKSAKMLRFRTAKISWESVLGADGYAVYRKTARGEWKWLDNVTGTQYTDRTPEMDQKYYYSVRAYREYDGKKNWSGRDKKGIEITLKSTIDPKKPMVALTYDDGPGKYTNQILDVFEKYDAHATFFVVGRNAANNPSTLKRAYDLGCEIGNHSYSHPYLTRLSNGELESQISKTDKVIKDAIGVSTTLIRPPYGSQSERVRSKVDKAFILWSVDTLDWKHRSASKNLACVKKNVRDGSIVLMHDIHKCTADSAESIVSYLKKQGYQLVTVSELAYYKGSKLNPGSSHSRFY